MNFQPPCPQFFFFFKVKTFSLKKKKKNLKQNQKSKLFLEINLGYPVEKTKQDTLNFFHRITIRKFIFFSVLAHAEIPLSPRPFESLKLVFSKIKHFY